MLPRERIKPRPITVKEVQKVMNVYSSEQMQAAQQMIGFFGVSPKLERILWAAMYKEHLRHKRWAEELTYGGTYDEEDPTHRLIQEEREGARIQRKMRRGEIRTPPKPQEKITEPPELTQVVDVCTCGRTMVGTVVPTCSKIKRQPIFYKECTGCSRYVEVHRRIKANRTTYYSSEGG
jgi:hypothetical protein